jgi:hypothetical protein
VVARKLSAASSRVISTPAARASDRDSDSRLRTVGFWRRGRLPAAHLLVHLEVAGLEHADERARLELWADRVDLGELRAAAEDVEKTSDCERAR